MQSLKRVKNNLIKRNIPFRSVALEESNNEEAIDTNENYNSDIVSMSLDESRYNNTINLFDVNDLIKKNSVMEKDDSGCITYTKTEYYKNNKKVITQILFDKNKKMIHKTKNVCEENDDSNDNSNTSEIKIVPKISLSRNSNNNRNNNFNNNSLPRNSIGNKNRNNIQQRNNSKNTNNNQDNNNNVNNNNINNNVNNNNVNYNNNLNNSIQQNVSNLMNYMNNILTPTTPQNTNTPNNNFSLNNSSFSYHISTSK